jgi:hypothetical protein
VVVADAGYDIIRLAHVLADLPIELVGRLRSDRVLRLPKPPRPPGTTGRPPTRAERIKTRVTGSLTKDAFADAGFGALSAVDTGRGGGLVVVAGLTTRRGGREDRPQGEGGQQVRSRREGTPGDRR